MAFEALAPWMDRWRLTADGAPFATHIGSQIAPVRTAEGAPAMLKIASGREERRGGAMMVWLAGDGAARVLARSGPAILLERAMGERSLARMARSGRDDEATRILCAAAARIHAPRAAPPASLTPLARWFRALPRAARRHGGILAVSWTIAQALLADQTEARPLHGDLHHGNVLDGGGRRGWLAIDPKGLIGDRAFDYANMACNPDIATAGAPGVLARRVRIIAGDAGLAPRRYLKWLLAYAGLSASWTLAGGGEAGGALSLARLAAGELGLAV